MVLYPILISQSWSTIVPNFMLVSGIAQSGQNLALSRLATRAKERLNMLHIINARAKKRLKKFHIYNAREPLYSTSAVIATTTDSLTGKRLV